MGDEPCDVNRKTLVKAQASKELKYPKIPPNSPKDLKYKESKQTYLIKT